MIYPIVGIGIALMILERIFPDQTLPKVPQWWNRVILLNLFELAIVVTGALTWERWLHSFSLLNLRGAVSAPLGATIVYVVLTFIYYWWHRARHDINFLWLTMHQVHHSPQRIETITSFYKHPLEIFANALVIGTTSCVIFGLNAEGAAFVNLYTAVAEYFYHMNIRTPRWVGYFIQRPESHRIHHQLGYHYDNFADLPLWDILFGTYQNPETYQGKCGFRPERESRLWDMLRFRNVNGAPKIGTEKSI